MEHIKLESAALEHTTTAVATDASPDTVSSQRFGCAMYALARPVARRQQRVLPTWRALGRELWLCPQILASRLYYWAQHRND
ncbi:hypothetical protein [Chitinimonas naiadis]